MIYGRDIAYVLGRIEQRIKICDQLLNGIPVLRLDNLLIFQPSGIDDLVAVIADGTVPIQGVIAAFYRTESAALCQLNNGATGNRRSAVLVAECAPFPEAFARLIPAVSF